MEEGIMQQMVEYICMVMGEKYCVDLKGKWVCTKDKNLGCICLSGEILNQALSNLLLFFEVSSDYNVALKRIGDSICPIVFKDGEQYIGIAKNEKILFDLNAINCKPCLSDGKIYIRPQIPVQSFKKEKYMSLLKLSESLLQDKYRSIGNQDRKKYRFLMHIIKRVRILNDRRQVHFALLCLRCFIAPGKTLDMISKYVKDDNMSDEDILNFIERYIYFLKDLKYGARDYTISVNYFAEIFKKIWIVDISWILSEYGEEKSILELLEVLRSSVSDNLKQVVLKKWRGILEQIKLDEFKGKKVIINNMIDEL